ncbi:conserved hypothetical protein [Candida dubliniensis CD36]|uniref:Intimal thickness related receptor IRP domain-containing protein n=1 Tax=Candida dubliniensis (strain CD36 / ATCC MYA-646 / CBS 7987 / NCPF 3949 / NRRL Y-17841) TaxID=573826 RepID=B9WMS5_CANDC|nr:conserved hypothetical protein [Candida dubliniensis CD36]CAX40391.1 conserved hypothetical protein [Candida dubliniensis CD36]
MKYLSSLISLVFVQLSLVLAASNRRFMLTYNSNGACVAINNTTPETQLTLDFNNVGQDTIPLVVFQYLDFFKFKNIPNFDDFVNYIYLENKKFIKTNQKSNSVAFDLKLVNNRVKTPETFLNKTITQDQVVKYNVPNPGVYCIYLPMYSFDDKRTHFTSYYTFVTVENEGISENILTELSTQVNLIIMFGSVILVLIYLYPSLRTGKHGSKLSPVLTQLFQFLLVNLVYRIGFLILWAIYFVSPTDVVYNFVVNYYSHLQQVFLDNWLGYITLSVYFGSAYSNLPMDPPQFLVKLLIGVNILATFIPFQILSNTLAVNDITVNSESYQIIDKSILVNKAYKSTISNFHLDWEKIVVMVTTSTQLITSVLAHLISTGYGFRLYWKLKKSDNKRLARPLLQSILLHLISWRIFGKSTIIGLYGNLNLTGVFDVGEMLSVIGNLIELQNLKLMGFQIVEVLLVWFIWSSKKPLDCKEIEGKNNKNY